MMFAENATVYFPYRGQCMYNACWQLEMNSNYKKTCTWGLVQVF